MKCQWKLWRFEVMYPENNLLISHLYIGKVHKLNQSLFLGLIVEIEERANYEEWKSPRLSFSRLHVGERALMLLQNIYMSVTVLPDTYIISAEWKQEVSRASTQDVFKISSRVKVKALAVVACVKCDEIDSKWGVSGWGYAGTAWVKWELLCWSV